MTENTWNRFSKKYVAGGGGTNGPAYWWNYCLTEDERQFLISRLQESDARYARQYGSAKSWPLIPTAVQEMLQSIE